MSLVRGSFQRFHYPTDIILLCVRWYLSYALSLRNLEEMMYERGIRVDHSTIHRWILRLSGQLAKKVRTVKSRTGLSWKMCMINKGQMPVDGKRLHPVETFYKITA